jgi:pimeloyl-ACP methyl ester carboxylesterase
MQRSEERISLLTSDSTRLTALWRRSRGDTVKAVAVLAHGITVEKDEAGFYARLARFLAESGVASLRFDFRGHGESSGASTEMTIAGEIRDLDAAILYAKKRVRSLRPAIVATSFGASIAVLWASKHSRALSSLTLLCPVLDYEKTFLDPRTEWGRRWFGRKRVERASARGYLDVDGFRLGLPLIKEWSELRPFKAVQRLSVPTIIVHGTADSMVPYEVAEETARHLRNGKFVAVPGADHGFEDCEELIHGEVRDWILRHVPR